MAALNERNDADDKACTSHIHPTVSVIVPVYNVEEYLEKAIASLFAQTVPDGALEIVCVDDGSSDGSAALLAQYEARTSAGRHRFPMKVITQPRNFGYGRAMNTGIAAASGEFIGILEPDDFTDADMFESLINIARKHDADVVKSNYYDHRANVNPDRFEEAMRGYRYNVPLCADEDESLLFMRPCIWSAIYRRDFLLENHIRFNETPGASFQDTGFAFQVAACARRLVLVRDAYVHYRIDNASSSCHSKKKEFAIYDEMSLIESFVNVDAERRERFSPAMVYRLFWLHEWNRRRIGNPDSREIADALMSAKLRRAAAEGTLKRRYFDDGEWAEVERLLAYLPPCIVKAAADIATHAVEDKEREYLTSWSYRAGHALLAPARLLRGFINNTGAKRL